VVYPLRATLQGAAGDRLHLLHLAADVDYLVCEVDCVPYRYTLTLDQPLGASPVPDPDTAPLLAAWWDRLPAPAESLAGVATGVACDGCPPLPDLLARYEKAGGTFMVCPVCFNAKQLDKGDLIANAELAGSVQLWEWIGDEGATTFSY